MSRREGIQLGVIVQGGCENLTWRWLELGCFNMFAWSKVGDKVI